MLLKEKHHIHTCHLPPGKIFHDKRSFFRLLIHHSTILTKCNHFIHFFCEPVDFLYFIRFIEIYILFLNFIAKESYLILLMHFLF